MLNEKVNLKIWQFVSIIAIIMIMSITTTYQIMLPYSETVKSSVDYNFNTELVSNYKETPNQYGKVVHFVMDGVYPIEPDIVIPGDDVGMVGAYSTESLLVRYMIETDMDIRRGDDVYMKINYIQEIVEDKWYIVYGEVLHYE